MNIFFTIISLSLTFNLVLAYTVDKTLALIYTPAETSLILQSDLRPGLDGQSKTLDQVIIDRLMLADAKKLKMTVTEGEIDRYLSKVEEQNKLTREQTKELFKSMGYSYEEARNQLRDMQLIEQIKEHRYRTKVLVSSEEIETYYNANPEYEEALYTISQGFASFNGGSKAIKKALVRQGIESGDIKTTVQWSPPIELKDVDIAEDKAYIKNLNPGAIEILKETDEGIVLIQLIAKKDRRKVTLAESRRKIAALLSKDRLLLAEVDYRKSLKAPPNRIRYVEKEQAIVT